MSFCKKCKPKIKAFMKKLDALLMGNMDKAFQITSMLKTFFDLKVFDSLTYLTKGKFDDQLLHSLRGALEIATNKIFPTLQTKGLDVFALIDLLTRTLCDATKDTKDAHLVKIASIITSILDGRYNTYEYDAAVQTYYTLNKR